MPAKSKKKSKNRVEEEKIAPTHSRLTRAKDKKNNEDVALALARSQLDQIKLNEAKELDQNELDLALRRSLSDAPETPRAYITVGGVTHVSSAAYVAPNPELDALLSPLPIRLPPRKSPELVVLGSTLPKNKLSLVLGKESLKSPLKWGEGLLSKPKRLEPPSCSPVALPETNAELKDSSLESNNSVERKAKSEDEVEVVDTPPSSVKNSIKSIEEVHVPTPQVEMESNNTSIELIEGEESSSSASTASASTSESTSSDSASVADSITTIETGGLSGNEQSIAEIDRKQASSSKGNVGKASSDSESGFCVRMDGPDVLFESSDEAAARNPNRDGIFQRQPESSLDSSASSSEAMVPLTVSQAVINKLLLDSSDWANEESVLASIKKESLCNARYKSLAIQPKVLAHLLMKSQEVQFEKEKLALARFKSQEAMEKDYSTRLGKMYVEHKEKTVIQTAELNLKLKEVEDLKRTLEMRLKASQVMQEESSAIQKNYEEVVKDNLRLQQSSKRMWEQLKAVQDGISVSAFNPAVAVSASGNDSAHSSASFVSVASTMRSDVGRCESLSPCPTGDGKKRDRSPGVKRSGNNKVTFKKPRSRREIMEDWNEEGNRVTRTFCEDRCSEFKTLSDEVLEQMKLNVKEASDDFKAHFDGEVRDAGLSVRQRNEYRHSSFSELHMEYGIPSLEQGRTVAVLFYYGKVIGVINGVLSSRKLFTHTPSDPRKINEYINFLRSINPRCPKVEDFQIAEKNLKHINTDSRDAHDVFLEQFREMEVIGGSRKPWMKVQTYNNLQALALTRPRANTLERATLLGVAKGEFTVYHHFKYRHEIMDFYGEARTYRRDTFNSAPNSGRPLGSR